MINLSIAIASATAAFLVGMFVAGHWIAGFLPAVLVLLIVYFVLARRTSNQLQAIMEQAGKAIQRQKVDEARRVLETARPLGRWQFLVAGQIEAQLGALAYLERDWKKARAHLDKAFSRNWMAQGMLAAMDLREKDAAAGIERLEKASGFAKKEALFWGLYAYILAESKQQDEALEVLARGLKVMPENEGLKGLQKAISNKRRKLKMGTLFGNQWYTFFPEQFPVRRYQNAAMQGRGFPQPRR
jgi:tetratricopeptide (TPR) repeat protein